MGHRMTCKRRFDEAPAETVCPLCHHTALLHPGRHNPSLGWCLVCVVERLVDDGR